MSEQPDVHTYTEHGGKDAENREKVRRIGDDAAHVWRWRRRTLALPAPRQACAHEQLRDHEQAEHEIAQRANGLAKAVRYEQTVGHYRQTELSATGSESDGPYAADRAAHRNHARREAASMQEPMSARSAGLRGSLTHDVMEIDDRKSCASQQVLAILRRSMPSPSPIATPWASKTSGSAVVSEPTNRGRTGRCC